MINTKTWIICMFLCIGSFSLQAQNVPGSSEDDSDWKSEMLKNRKPPVTVNSTLHVLIRKIYNNRNSSTPNPLFEQLQEIYFQQVDDRRTPTELDPALQRWLESYSNSWDVDSDLQELELLEPYRRSWHLDRDVQRMLKAYEAEELDATPGAINNPMDYMKDTGLVPMYPSDDYMKDTELVPMYPSDDYMKDTEFKHFCHLRGSMTSVTIYSQEMSEYKACEEKGLEAGLSSPLLHICLDEHGNISDIVSSPLSEEEACKGRINMKDTGLGPVYPSGDYIDTGFKNPLENSIILYKDYSDFMKHFYLHYCHFPGDQHSTEISSENSNREQACAEKGMEASNTYACLNDEGGILSFVYSPLSEEEACGQNVGS